MIGADVWREYLAMHTHLFHVTPEANLDGVLAEGLIPGNQRGQTTRTDFFSPRPNHVYLIKQADIVIVDVNAEPRVVAIELSFLDPDLVDPDEDIVKDCFPHVVDVRPPVRQCDDQNNELPGQVGLLARWADTTLGFDTSDVAARSLREYGRMSYRGTIPPEAIRKVFVPSDPIAAFVEALDEGLNRSLAVPHRSTAGTEIQRSRVIAKIVTEEICAALGQAVDVHLDDPYTSREAPGEVRRAAIALFRAERLEAGQVVGTLVDVLGHAGRFSGYAPRSDLHTAADLAAATADAVNQFARVAGIGADRAALVAEHAVQAASALPPAESDD